MDSRVIVNKLGIEHYEEEWNNQDFLISLPTMKIVLDGCGSKRFSEVGTRLFSQLFVENFLCKTEDESFEDIVKITFEKLMSIFSKEEQYANNLSFTILACIEREDEFIVYSCGDGYIITDDGEKIEFIQLDDGEFPKYYIYNYVSKENLQCYQDGVNFTIHCFKKTEYKNIGVATDGLRFYEDLIVPEKFKLFEFLKEGKSGKIKMLINRNRGLFKDDITICF